MFGVSVSPMAGAQVNITTEHNDIGRTGQNLSETILTTSNVNSTEFGKLFSQPVNGAIYAQPLYLSGVVINAAAHNVVYVASVLDVVYAFDADSNDGANASPLWSASMLTAAHGAAAGAQTYGGLGITGTPVIDPVSNTLYVVAATFEGGQVIYRLHALDVTSGAEKFDGPVAITASDGVVPFVPVEHNQRPALLLLNGVVYVSFGAWNESFDIAWHGWVIGYETGTLTQTGVFCASPNGNKGGIWMSGAGLAADQLDPVNYPYGRMFLATANGDYTASYPYGNNMDYGDSVVDLDLTNGVPNVTDEFTPYTQAMLATDDLDQGSGGVMILPTQTAGSHPNLLVQAGKSGSLFLLDRDDLGGYSTTSDQVVQELTLALGNTGPLAGGGVWSSPAYWNGNVYYWGVYDHLKSFPLVNGLLAATPTMSTELSAYPSTTPSISANGSTQGIVWTINADAYTTGGPAILQAHDAGNVATTLYSSATNAARDGAGPAAKLAVPTIANGMVYVGTANQLDVYGLFNASQTVAPTFSPGSESFTGSVAVTITSATPDSAIYYTTNGTAATVSSPLYTGPVTVKGTETINAVAAAPGLAVSYQASASYSKPGTAMPTLSPAAIAYPGAVAVTITDATAGAVIYYTTDGSKPTTASPVYPGPITVSSSETINALAVAPGYSKSNIGSATYTISSSIPVNEGAGFTSTTGLNFVGTPTLINNALQMSVANGGNEDNAVWFTTPVNVQAFTTDFYFQITSATADGFTFAIQNSPAGLYAVGSGAGGLGYQGIASSVAVKFDLYNDAGEGTNSTGFYTDGASPTVPSIDMTGSGVVLHNPDILHAHITYDGTTLTLNLSDTVTNATFKASTAINIPATVGGNSAYVGFTASTSAAAANQSILNWTYAASGSSGPMVGTPTFTPAPGTYTSAQSVTILDATNGATIYFTTNGTMPTTSSTRYSVPIGVSADETVQAIATQSGYSNSAVGSATYNIGGPAPTFTPAGGTYPGTQSVTIGDSIAGSAIYYTTNGTAPTTSSTKYSVPVSVSANETLKAIAVPSGYSASPVAAAVYKIEAAKPTFTPAGGTYTSAQSVTIGDAATGATIYYTTDGTTPTTSSSQYSVPISVTANETLKANAVLSGLQTSPVGTAVYKIEAAAPTFTPAAGTYTSTQSVTISDAATGAAIYYTTDGSTPTTSSTRYSVPVSVSVSEKLKAIAVVSGNTTSPIAVASYTIK